MDIKSLDSYTLRSSALGLFALKVWPEGQWLASVAMENDALTLLMPILVPAILCC